MLACIADGGQVPDLYRMDWQGGRNGKVLAGLQGATQAREMPLDPRIALYSAFSFSWISECVTLISSRMRFVAGQNCRYVLGRNVRATRYFLWIVRQ